MTDYKPTLGMPIFELPKFEYENQVIDLQKIRTPDPAENGKIAEQHVKAIVSLMTQKLIARQRAIVNVYVNLHPKIKIAFVLIVHVDLPDINLKPLRMGPLDQLKKE
jgi:hypothetical protein